MKTLGFEYIRSISGKDINTLEDILRDERLRKYLWLEFIFNPEAVNAAQPYIHEPVVKKSLTDALSWYLAFRWILPENKAIECLYNERVIVPYRIKLHIYRQMRRNFIKGLIYAGLC